MDNWKWTDLMPGDKLKMTKEQIKTGKWKEQWNNKIVVVERFKIYNDLIYIFFNNIRDIHIANYIFMSLDGQYNNIQVFDIIELAEDK